MYGFNWLYRLIRSRTKPIPEYSAAIWKRRLSFAYAIIAWNAFGVVGYMIYTGRGDWAQYYGYKDKAEASLSPAQQWSKTLGIKEATVYRISGFNVKKYNIHNSFEDDASNETNVDSTETTETHIAT